MEHMHLCSLFVLSASPPVRAPPQLLLLLRLVSASPSELATVCEARPQARGGNSDERLDDTVAFDVKHRGRWMGP